MITLTIDGTSVTVPEGSTVLEAAQKAGASIPTLCHHPGLAEHGGCRLCVVDVIEPAHRKMVISCMLPAREGLVVDTKSERVLATRKTLLELMLARSPKTPYVIELARAHGVTESSFATLAEPSGCILCALCTRACEQVGARAISMVGRGGEREVATPFFDDPMDCIGCLACAYICPTGYIEYTEDEDQRTIFGRVFARQKCKACGRAHITLAHAEFLRARSGLGEDFCELCDECKRAALVKTAVALGDERGA